MVIIVGMVSGVEMMVMFLCVCHPPRPGAAALPDEQRPLQLQLQEVEALEVCLGEGGQGAGVQEPKDGHQHLVLEEVRGVAAVERSLSNDRASRSKGEGAERPPEKRELTGEGRVPE